MNTASKDLVVGNAKQMVFLKGCPACEEAQFKHYYPYFETNLVRCLKCGLIFANPRPTDAWIMGYYASSPVFKQEAQETSWFGSPQERVMEVKHPEGFRKYNMMILDDIKHFTKPGRILDVGCSTGTLLRMAKDAGWEVLGIEPSEAAASYAREKHNIEVRAIELDSLGLTDSSYDCVTMIHVLEHLTNLQTCLDRVWSFLKNQGIFYLRVPNVNSMKYRLIRSDYFLHVPEHLTWFSYTAAKILLEMHGFKVIKAYTSCFSNDPYFYFGIVKRLKLHKLLFSMLRYNNKQWKEEDGSLDRLKIAVDKPKSKRYSFVERTTQLLNIFWPKRLISYLGMGDELVLVAKKSTRIETVSKIGGSSVPIRRKLCSSVYE